MVIDDQRNRKWERYACLLPCRIVSPDHENTSVDARIINIGRGGLLVESDYTFTSGERVTIALQPDCELEHFDMDHEIHGAVRWGQIDATSLMGLFYVGVEFDELLPLKQAVGQKQ